jgi:hypothetical protein
MSWLEENVPLHKGEGKLTVRLGGWPPPEYRVLEPKVIELTFACIETAGQLIVTDKSFKPTSGYALSRVQTSALFWYLVP